MPAEKFETMLTGGHPNSLGRTIEVVDIVLADQRRLEELYNCYFSDDEVVRLRTSSAMKRISLVNSDWLVPYLDRLIGVISKIDQASTRWTLALLFETLAPDMTAAQFKRAREVMKTNLEHHNDWIVLNNTMQTLSSWALHDAALKEWLLPHLQRLSADSRKSVAARAKKFLLLLN